MDQGALRWSGDLSLGAWIAPRLVGPFGRVTSMVPGGFAAYARVLHPVGGPGQEAMSWAGVCALTGRTPHALMQWLAICAPEVDDGSGRAPVPGQPWQGGQPALGTLAPSALGALCQVLGEHSAAGVQCCFALCEGYGWIWGGPSAEALLAPLGEGPPSAPAASGPAPGAGARLLHPGRGYLLLTGALGAAAQMGWWPAPDRFQAQSPNLFWPDDRSWCVASEIDADSTLVAGSTALVQAILDRDDLEAWPVGPADLVGIDADTINF